MLNDRLLGYLKNENPRSLPKLNLFLSFLDGKIKDGLSRASATTVSTNGIRLLTQIIRLADPDTLIHMSTGKRHLGEYLLSIVSELEKPIDVRTSILFPKSMFVKTRLPCFELISPSRRRNPLSEIPIYSDWNDRAWSNVNPLRIVDIGECDLTFKVYESKLDFYNKSPSHVIYTLDCLALIAKFLAYYRYNLDKVDLNTAIRDFLHYEIIVPTLLNDSVSLWLRNIYSKQFISSSRLESLTSARMDNITTDTLGTTFTAAMTDIYHLRSDLEQESITGLSVLSSLIVSPDGTNFIDYYKELYSTTRLSDSQAYIWVECLKNMYWWNLVLLISSYTPDSPRVISFQRDLIREARFWRMIKPWQEIPQVFNYRTFIRNYLETMYQYLKGI